MNRFISIKKTVAVFSVLLLLVSCKVMLVPPYSAELENQIITNAKATDKLYIDMLDVPVANRLYDSFKDRYNEIEAEINSIQLKNEARQKNADFLVIIKNLKDAFAEAKKYHKDNKTISNGEAKVYQSSLAAFWKPLYKAEKALKE
jgi:hypothetical protein